MAQPRYERKPGREEAYRSTQTRLAVVRDGETEIGFYKIWKAFCLRGDTGAQMFSIFDFTASKPAAAFPNGTHSGRQGVLASVHHVRDISSWFTEFWQEISSARSVYRSLKMSFVLLSCIIRSNLATYKGYEVYVVCLRRLPYRQAGTVVACLSYTGTGCAYRYEACCVF